MHPSTTHTMTHPRLSGAKILIVDDDEDILSSINLAMRAEGALTMTSTDGSDAIAVCHSHKPEVVILDMMLPRASGFLVLEKIKQGPDAPIVVMITANQGKRHMEYAKGMGIDAYLYKPVALSRLVTTIAELIARGAPAVEAEPEPSGEPAEKPEAAPSKAKRKPRSK